MNDTPENYVVCVWAGTFASEQDHRDYMEMQYDDDGDASSRFGIDTGSSNGTTRTSWKAGGSKVSRRRSWRPMSGACCIPTCSTTS